MNLMLLEPDELDSSGVVVLRDRRAEHIRKVLRASPEDRLRVGVVNGPRGTATVRRIDAAGIELVCALDPADHGDAPRLDLIIALPRPQTLKKLLLEATSLGVRRFLFVGGARTDPSYFQTKVLREDLGRAHRLRGLEQCGATRLPELTLHRKLHRLLDDELDGLLQPGTRRLLLHPGGPPLACAGVTAEPVALAIGPEGGWLDKEVGRFTDAGFETRGLGGRILRVETAAIAAMAQVQAQRAQFEERSC